MMRKAKVDGLSKMDPTSDSNAKTGQAGATDKSVAALNDRDAKLSAAKTE